MNLIKLQQQFNTHSKCIKHLEKVRWGNEPACLHCGSLSITPRKSNKANIGYIKKPKNRLKLKPPAQIRHTPMYHCNDCNKDFSVLYGTIFEGSKMSLQKWFMLIALMLNARQGISAPNIMRIF